MSENGGNQYEFLVWYNLSEYIELFCISDTGQINLNYIGVKQIRQHSVYHRLCSKYFDIQFDKYSV